MIIHLMDFKVREKIRESFEQLEKELKIDGLGTVITTAMLELVENAVKANLKRVYFARNGFDLDDSESYRQGMKAFVASYGQLHGEDFRTALENLDLIVTVDIDRTGQRLIVYVENNTLLLTREEKRIRNQLSAAMKMDKLVDFYMHYGDESEGSGLGLAMIVFLIRSLGFDPKNFRVFTMGKKTTARLEFPMAENYVPIRDKFCAQYRAI